MEKCSACEREIKQATTTLKQKTMQGKAVRVVNVPAKKCSCKNEHSAMFSFYHAIIAEDFVKKMNDDRDIVDFNEIQEKYKGLTTMDVIEMNKRENS